MVQIVTVECAQCEDVSKIEFAGCIITGYIDGELHLWRHDIGLKEMKEIAAYLEGYVAGSKDSEGGRENDNTF